MDKEIDMKWQPIKTAPYNDEVLLCIEGKWVTTGSKTRGIGWLWNMIDEEDDDSEPTHWMPLPAPPKD